LRSHYVAEVRDRISAMDRALEEEGDPEAMLGDLFRHVHTIKGASGMVGDEPMAWFCHILEERLRAANTRAALPQSLRGMPKVLAILTGLLEASESTVARLRREPLREYASAAPDRDSLIRVPAVALEDLTTQLSSLTAVGDALRVLRTDIREAAQTTRALRAQLTEALQLIGPPKPWGAPAAAVGRVDAAAQALTRLTERLESTSRTVLANQMAFDETGRHLARGFAVMRQVGVRGMLERVATGLHADATRAGVAIQVRVDGGDELLDRKVLDTLTEACMHAARNCVAHGVPQTPEARAARQRQGKPEALQVTLRANRAGQRLLVEVIDDGEGIDAAKVESAARRIGHLPANAQGELDHQAVLDLIFAPDLSTKDEVDSLAGRGVGLDIVRSTVRRLGGSVQVESHPGRGFALRMMVPFETEGVARVLWVSCGDGDRSTYGFIAHDVEEVRLRHPDEDVPALVEVIDASQPLTSTRPGHELARRGGVTLRLRGFAQDDDASIVAVESTLALEDVALQPLSPLMANLGPFFGAVLRPGGDLCFVLDAAQVARRARGRAPTSQRDHG
jgi:chemotaxis protein histidine kinase CheA